MKKPLLSLIASIALLGSTQAQTGASLNFDGIDDYVASNAPIVHGSQFTYEAWIQTSSPNDWGGIMSTSTTGGQPQWVQFTLTGAGRLKTEIVDDAGNNKWYEGTTTLVNDGNWHHVAITYDGNNNLVLYVDGISQALLKQNDGTLGTFTINSTLYVGAERSLGPKFSGSIDEARIWNIARTQGEIQAYMNCNVTDTAAGLLAMYNFNEGVANGGNAARTTLYDVTGKGHDGTLNNFLLATTGSNYVADARTNYLGIRSTLTDINCNNTLGGAVAADFDGDGSKDLITGDWNGLTRMYLNDGRGNFPSVYTNPVPGGGYYEAADVDNDGDMDLIVASSNSVTVYANNGSGTFAAIAGNFFQGTGVANVTKVADVNGDNKKDLIVGNGGSGATDSSLIYINTGTTGNAAFTYYRGLEPNPGRNAIDVGDLNGDGFKDIITGGSSWGAQVFFNNNNNSTFSMQTPPAGYSGGARLVDWNQDGKLDYVNYDQYNNYGLRYVLNDGSGIFSATPTMLLQDYNAHVAKLGDLNGDGFLDAVIDNWGGNAKVYLSNGCALTLQTGCNYTIGRADNNVTLADYNGDGTMDIFCQARCASSSVYLNYLDPVVGTPLPNVTVTGNTAINYGSSTVLTANGAPSYQWSANAGSATTPSVSVNPTVPTTYTVVGTNTVGCSSSATVQVSINGAALDLDGNNDYVSLGNTINSVLAANNKITVEAWVNAASTGYLGCVVGNYQTSGSGMQFLLRLDNANPTFWVDNGSGFTQVISTATVATNTWTHLAGTWDGSLMSIYVNGVLSGTTAVSGTNFASSANEVWIGGNTAGTPEMLPGTVDEVRIWNRALCQGEIQNNMNGELHMPQTGLLGYYMLDEGVAGGNNATVTTAADSSGNSNTGTLSNFTLNGATSNWIAPGGVMSGNYVTTYAVPTLTVSGTMAICNGNSTVLTASGADTYTWITGPSTPSNTVSPTGNATYSVNGTSNGCPTSMAAATVTVNPLPTVNATATSMSVCLTDDDTLNVSGATTYTWSSNAGSVTTSSAVITPSANDTYTVTGTDGNGCVNTNTISITVINCSAGMSQISKNSLAIYPNPSNGNFTLNAGTEIGAVEVYNSLGVLVYKTATKDLSIQIDLSREAAGIYYLAAQGKKMMISKQ